MSNFRPIAPVAPKPKESLTFQANDEVRRGVETVSKSSIVNGRLTASITLADVGTTQTIEHKLGRAPLGFFVSYFIGDYPAFSVSKADTKHITIESQSSWAPVFKLWVF